MTMDVNRILEHVIAALITAAVLGALAYLSKLGPKIVDLFDRARKHRTIHDNANTILAILISAIVLILWQIFLGMPQMERKGAEQPPSQKTLTG